MGLKSRVPESTVNEWSFTVEGVPVLEHDLVVAVRRLRLLMSDQADLTDVRAFVHEGPPVSKSRARWSRKQQRFYTPQATKDAEIDLAWRFKAAARGEVLEGPVAILALFYRPNHQRIDADNLMKLVMDSATGAGIWLDDSQVTAQASYIEMDIERPRTVVAWSGTESTMVRGATFTCTVCGAEFIRPGLAAKRKTPLFCSIACVQRARSKDPDGVPLTVRVACDQCSTLYARKTTAQRFCSEGCRRDWLRGHHRARRAAPNLCCDCGIPTPNHHAARCRACWSALSTP